MRIGFELDNVIARQAAGEPPKSGGLHMEVVEGAKEILEDLRKQGHQIVIYTKRDSSQALDVENWLSKNGIAYAFVIFNRPAHLFMTFAPDIRQFVSWTGAKDELVRQGVLKENALDQQKKTMQVKLPKKSSSGETQDLKAKK